MSSISIAKQSLRSQVVRNIVGERTIDILAALTTNEPGEGGVAGFLGRLGGLAKFAAKIVGFLSQIALNLGKWLLRNVWDIFLEVAFEVATFDWNQTDAAIMSQIESNNLQIVAAAGSLLGTGTVWIGSVLIAGAAAIKFPVVAGKVALALAQEGGEEIRAQLTNLINTSAYSLARSSVLFAFLSARQLKLFGLAPVTTAKEPWTIADAIEQKIESIDNKAVKVFVESFLESAIDAVIEAGYVVTYAIDDFYSSQRMANNTAFGEQRAVELTPDKNAPDERIILRGAQTLIQQDIQTTLAGYQWVWNRDLGQMVGMPAEDWLKAGVQRRKLSIVFKSKEKPPWKAGAGEARVKEVDCTIPDAKMGLTWEKIKLAAKPFQWGRFRATANLDNGRQMAVYGATEQEAEQTLKRLLELSNANLLTLSVTEEKDRHPDLKKEPVTVYPAYAHLTVRRGTAEKTGLTDLSGQDYKQEHQRIELWLDSEPQGMPPLP